MENCPRCGIEAPLRALSRTDNRTHVCSACGTHEATQVFATDQTLAPQETWPVRVPLGFYEFNRMPT